MTSVQLLYRAICSWSGCLKSLMFRWKHAWTDSPHRGIYILYTICISHNSIVWLVSFPDPQYTVWGWDYSVVYIGLAASKIFDFENAMFRLLFDSLLFAWRRLKEWLKCCVLICGRIWEKGPYHAKHDFLLFFKLSPFQGHKSPRLPTWSVDSLGLLLHRSNIRS